MSCDIEAVIDQRPIQATIGEDVQVNVNGAILQMNGLVDNDYGDIVVTNNGGTMTIQNMDENATVTTGTYVSKVNQDLLIKARKATPGTITKGQVVYIYGSTGNHLTVELAKADAEATSARTIGIACTTITGTADGFVTQNGRLIGLSTLPTASFADGDALYLSETTAGGYRKGIPTAPNHGVFLGVVIKANNGNAGEMDVRIDNYQELEELSDVYINNETVNDFLIRKATRWENITPANVKTILDLSGTNTGDETPITVTTLTSSSNNLTVGKTGKIIRIDTTSNNVTATLPTAVGNTGYIYWIKRVTGGANVATINTTSSQTIDGQLTKTLNNQYDSIGIYSNGSNWEII